jgi:hypothetical protein
MTVSSDGMGALFRDYKRSAVRLETHQTYTMPNEQTDIARFLAGEPEPDDSKSNWLKSVRQNIAAGKTMQRIKFVRRPLTDYTRFLFERGIPGNIEAGEDYRIVDITDHDIAVPEQDFWLFDESTVLLLNFNTDGTLRNREIADPSELDKYLHWRDVALSEAVPFVDYQP